MSKKKLILAGLALTLVASGALVGCKKKEQTQTPTPPPVTYEVSLNSEQISMTIGDETPLIASFTKQDGATLTFTSSDETVVKVDENGKLLALKAGTATITATYGTASDTCVVTVGLNGLLPLLQLSNVSSDYLYIEQSTQLDLSGSVLFNGKTYTDVALSYSVAGDVGTVENGVFKPTKTGTAEITVTGTWRGVSSVSMTKTITVEVKPELVFQLNDGASEITLYTQTDKTSPFEVTATYGGEDLETTVEITSGSEYITYDPTAETVACKGITGEAEISVSYEIDGEEIVNVFPVHVKPTVYDFETTVTNFSAIHGDVVKGTTLRALLGGGFTSVTDENGNALTVDENKIYGVQSSDTGKFETTLTVYYPTHCYNVHIEGYTGIFAKAEDLAVLNMNGQVTKVNGVKDIYPIDEEKPVQKWEGYYVLANNIDATGYTHAKTGASLTQLGIQNEKYKPVGFQGTFDGQGYTVKGMTVGAHGRFGVLMEAEVKNVAFADVTLKDEKYASVLSGWIINSTLSNVYISVANTDKMTTTGSVLADGIQTSALKGCIVEMPETFGYAPVETTTTTTDPDTGAETTVTTYSNPAFKGSFTWQSLELSRDEEARSSFADVYVLSTEKLGWYGSGNYYLQGDGENLADEANGIKAYTLVGVKRYDTRSALETAGLSYTSFSSDYWTLVNGAPVWKSYGAEYPSVEVNDETPKKETIGGFDPEWLL